MAKARGERIWSSVDNLDWALVPWLMSSRLGLGFVASRQERTRFRASRPPLPETDDAVRRAPVRQAPTRRRNVSAGTTRDPAPDWAVAEQGAHRVARMQQVLAVGRRELSWAARRSQAPLPEASNGWSLVGPIDAQEG